MEQCKKCYLPIYFGWCKSCQIRHLREEFKNWTSGNKRIDNLIQEEQLKINSDNDIIFEWIPYSQFDDIKEEKKYMRDPNKNIVLKTSHDYINIIIEVKSSYRFGDLHGISQDPITKNFFIVLKEIYCVTCGKKYTSINDKWCKPCLINDLNLKNSSNRNEKINKLIQEMQLKISSHKDTIFELIPYSQFDEIMFMSKLCLAIWKNGPLYFDINEKKYTRNERKKVALKYVSNIQNISVEAEYYSIYYNMDNKIFGISQNPDTKDYIFVLEDVYCIKCAKKYTIQDTKWCSTCKIQYSGNTIIDDLIQKMQSKIGSYDTFEWIPYDQFNDIKEMDKGSHSIEVYSALWKNGSLNYDGNKNEYRRIQYENIALKNIYNLHSIFDEFNETKRHSGCKIYGISQNPDTKDYLMVLEIGYCNKCDQYTDVFEWIPYNQFSNIKEMDKCYLTNIFSAVWKNGPSYYDSKNKYIRKKNKNKRVNLKNLYNPQDIAKEFLNEVKNHSDCKVYGISQNPNTKDYIIVFGDTYCEKCIFEWVPYSRFDNIKEVGKGGFATVYSAIWRNGPLYYDNSKREYVRIQDKKVALKCLHNSQNISNKFLNEVKAYSTKKHDDYTDNNILKIYGISQNPNTKDYIMILDYAEGGNFDHWTNKNYKNFDWSYKLTTLWNIVKGLKGIHQKQMVHNDFHTGNILLSVLYVNNINDNSIYISDMGLCGKVDDINQNNIYGVMPYVAPEILKGKLYTQAADIYSFGMIMYFVATGKQPFSNCAHDKYLALKICNGIRPEINEPEIPKCYGDLMRKCWDSTPGNRPKATEILELIDLFFYSYKYDKFTFKRIVKIKKEQRHYEIENQFKEAEEYRKSHLTQFDENERLTTHSQAFYTSRLLNPYIKDLK
ncbi:kinase-like domain-containing protein [Rhizophagus clarus]|uniref:Kinase-like domain-containing protein n=1 Tax=Rhizophagus clarus TaxID=94130 RepID=A0A8H3QW34_9GLOM|nr:kinase-like domain-containing protein [Rhizophagus clarus]